jgi:hypothetical protein
MFSNSQSPELNKLISETNNKLKHLNTNICCKLDNIDNTKTESIPVYAYTNIEQPKLKFTANPTDLINNTDVFLYQTGSTRALVIPKASICNCISGVNDNGDFTPDLDIAGQKISYVDSKGGSYTNEYEGNISFNLPVYAYDQPEKIYFSIRLERKSGFVIIYEGYYIIIDAEIEDFDPVTNEYFKVESIISNTNNVHNRTPDDLPNHYYQFKLAEYIEKRVNDIVTYTTRSGTPITIASFQCLTYAPIEAFKPLNINIPTLSFNSIKQRIVTYPSILTIPANTAHSISYKVLAGTVPISIDSVSSTYAINETGEEIASTFLNKNYIFTPAAASSIRVKIIS